MSSLSALGRLRQQQQHCLSNHRSGWQKGAAYNTYTTKTTTMVAGTIKKTKCCRMCAPGSSSVLGIQERVEEGSSVGHAPRPGSRGKGSARERMGGREGESGTGKVLRSTGAAGWGGLDATRKEAVSSDAARSLVLVSGEGPCKRMSMASMGRSSKDAGEGDGTVEGLVEPLGRFKGGCTSFSGERGFTLATSGSTPRSG
jgi:hypothetical protein